MIDLNRNKAMYHESITDIYVEDIEDHALEEYHDGWVTFSYDNIKDIKKKTNINGIVTTNSHKILETKANLPFKNGDLIKIGNCVYTIEEVEKKIIEDFRTIINLNPTLEERYTVKVLTLYEQ